MYNETKSSGSQQTIRDTKSRIRSMIHPVLNPDAPTQSRGYMLHLPVFPGNSMMKISAHVLYPDHHTIFHRYCFYVNTLVLCTLNGSIDQVPEYIRQHVLICSDAQIPGNFVQNKVMTSYGQWQQALHQLGDNLVQRYFSAWNGLFRHCIFSHKKNLQSEE
jgi:hypothetical protein